MRKLLALLLFLLIPTALSADSWSPVAWQTIPAPAGITYPVGPVGGGGLGDYLGNPIGPLIPSFSGPTTITVEDCCIVGDVYEVIVGGVSVGLTSPEPMGGSTLSSGTFYVADASAGIAIWDITLSYIGYDSPFGGGLVGSYMSPAGLDVTAVPTPEPTSLLLLGSAGLVGLACKLKRKKS